MPPIDRSRRDLSIGGIRLVWEVQEHTWLGRSLKLSGDEVGEGRVGRGGVRWWSRWRILTLDNVKNIIKVDSTLMIFSTFLRFGLFRPKSTYQVGSWTSQTSLMPPIDRSRRDLSIGAIRLVWEVREHTWKCQSLTKMQSRPTLEFYEALCLLILFFDLAFLKVST